MSLADLQALTSFAVRVRLRRDETTLDAVLPGRSEPVARVHKPAAYSSRQPYQMFVGAGLAEPVGFIAGFTLFGPDRAQLGKIGDVSGRRGRPRWEVERPGLPTMVSRPVGASASQYRFPFTLPAAILGGLLPFRFSFEPSGPSEHSGPFEPRQAGVGGFVITRRGGIRSRFEVTVDDPLLDRRVVLAAVTTVNQFGSEDLRKDLVDGATNPFRR